MTSEAAAARPRPGPVWILLPLALLLAFKPFALLLPPYWDAVLGIFHEGLFLADNGFDYRQLALAPDYAMGGPRVYLYSLYPGLVGLGSNWLSKPEHLFIALHALSLLSASACVYLLFRLLDRHVARGWALAGAALLFINPLFLSQAYAIGMDMPVTFLVFGSIYLLCQGRAGLAVLVMLCAFAFKQTAAVPALACFLFCLFMTARGDASWKNGLWFLLMPLSLVILPVAEGLLLGSDHPGRAAQALDPMLLINPFMAAFAFGHHLLMYPDGWTLLFLSVAGGLFFFLLGRERLGGGGLVDRVAANPTLAINLLVLACLMAAFLAATLWLPRYVLIALPSMYFLLTIMAASISRAGMALALLLLTLSLFNMHGRLYEHLPTPRGIGAQPGGHMTERSLRWLDDQQHYFDLVERLDGEFRDETFLVPAPLNMILHEPRLGYVSKPFSVITFGAPRMDWNGLPSAMDFQPRELTGSSTIWIDTKTIFSPRNALMQQKEKVLFRVPERPARFVGFRKALIDQ